MACWQAAATNDMQQQHRRWQLQPTTCSNNTEDAERQVASGTHTMCEWALDGALGIGASPTAAAAAAALGLALASRLWSPHAAECRRQPPTVSFCGDSTLLQAAEPRG